MDFSCPRAFSSLLGWLSLRVKDLSYFLADVLLRMHNTIFFVILAFKLFRIVSPELITNLHMVMDGNRCPTDMVAHLPPSIKHLLTLRNPKVLPSPSLSKLSNVFTSTFADAQAKKAETSWLVLTVWPSSFINGQS